MALHVLYVEDREPEFDRLARVVGRLNEDLPVWSKVNLSYVKHPSELPAALSENPDVVLADVYFISKETEEETDHLDEIIQHVKNWDSKSPYGFPTPVIAYTGKGPTILKKCLKRKESLYDIWSKMSADENYVAWRFQRLAAELTRHRPDATIQRLITSMEMEYCPNWHQHVLNLVRSYGEGQTEYDQIRKCRDPLQSILDELSERNSASLIAFWTALTDSEPLLRAVNTKLRGIARHSINVFWLGYWLINNPILQIKFLELWKQMLDSRADVQELKSIDPKAGLNTVWALASLFHDAGKFHEHFKTITEKSGEYFKEFGAFEMGIPKWDARKSKTIPKILDQLLFEISRNISDQMVNTVRDYIKKCSDQEHPDHGAVAAAYLLSIGGLSEATKNKIFLSSMLQKLQELCYCIAAYQVYSIISQKIRQGIARKLNGREILLHLCLCFVTKYKHGIDMIQIKCSLIIQIGLNFHSLK